MATIVGTRSPLFYKKQPGGIPAIIDVGRYAGNIFFVDSNAVGAGDTTAHGITPDAPFATIDYAIGRCTTNQGDVILVMPGHSETLAALITADIAGIKVIGLGEANDRPTIRVAAVIDGISITAADVILENLCFVTPAAAATALINIAAARAGVRSCRFELGTSVVDAITITAAGEEPVFEDNEVIVLADGPDSWLKFEGVIDKPVIRRNVVIGSDGTNAFDDGVLDFNNVAVTNAVIVNNVFGDGNVAVTVFANGGNVVGEVIGPNSYAALATNADNTGVTLASFAADSITAAAIAANAIGASELAADAVAEIADGVVDEAVAGHVTAGTVGAMLQPLHSAAAQAGAAGNITLAATASAVNDLYNGCIVQIIGGTGIGQARLVTDYDGGTKVATVAPNWATNPAAASVYVILPQGSAMVNGIAAGMITAVAIATDAIDADALAADAVAEIADGIADEPLAAHLTPGTVGAMLQPLDSGTAQAGAAGTITLAATASAVNDLYNGSTIQIVGGTGVGQSRFVYDYTGGTRIANVVPNWTTNPDNTSVYVIHPQGSVRVDAIAADVITAAAIANAAIDAATFAAGAIDATAIADNAIDATALAADAITNAKIADNAFGSEQFALSAGEKTTDGVVVTRAAAALPQSTAAAIFTVTGLVLLKRIVGYVTANIGAVANATMLVGNSTGAGAATALCGTLDINGHASDSRYEITGTFANAMVRTLDVPAALVQAAEIVIPPGTIDLNCAGSDGGGGRVRWSATYVPLEAGAQVVAA